MSSQPTPPVVNYASDQTPPNRVSGLAKTAMICGIIGIIFFPASLVGLITGVIALKRNRHPGTNRTYAVTGITTGSIGLVLFGIVTIGLVILYNHTITRVNRIHCGINLRQIALACKMYANDQPGQIYPDSFQTVVLAQDLTDLVFNCPSSNQTPASTGGGTDPKIWASKLSVASGTCSYIYITGHTDNDPGNMVLAYEPLSNHNDGSNFVFIDGHTDWFDQKQAAKAIAELSAGQNPPPSLK